VPSDTPAAQAGAGESDNLEPGSTSGRTHELLVETREGRSQRPGAFDHRDEDW